MMECAWQHNHILLQVFLCIALLTGLRADSIEWRQSGEQIEMACSTDKQNQGGLYLRHTYAETREVFYLTPEMKCSPRVAFDRRVHVKGLFTNFQVTISNLSMGDTGVFWCEYLRFEGAKQFSSKSNNPSVLVVVDGVKTCPTVPPHRSQTITAHDEPIQMSTLLTVSIITACSLILLVLIILLISVKRCCRENGNYKPRPQSDSGLPAHRSDSVYEQMRPQRATSLSHSSHSSAQVLINPAYSGQSFPQSTLYQQ